MAELTRGERLQIMLAEDELKAVDDWRFERRMPSRAAAVRELLRLDHVARVEADPVGGGLQAEGFLTAAAGKRSEAFGVLPQHVDGDGAAKDADGAAAPRKRG